ncbi:PEK kinase [Babesia ovis]|uniref:PEK kinase n=1 Tax=Babesia ovis TaxID=5869 RepID=A0A9W5WVI0_BABOV|nr:PEK kinase [Babesia ovis]
MAAAVPDVLGKLVKDDIDRLLNCEGVSVYIIDGGFLSTFLEPDSKNSSSFIAFEESTDENMPPMICRLEVGIRLERCIYGAKPRKETIITISIDIPTDYPKSDMVVKLVGISNAQSSFIKACRLKLSEPFSIEEGQSDQSHHLYNVVFGFYSFLQQSATQRGSVSSPWKFNDSSSMLTKSQTVVDSSSESGCDMEVGTYWSSSENSTGRCSFGRNNPFDVCMAARMGSVALHKLLSAHSRYYREFEHQKVLGSGSFGCVTQVSRNGIVYALKQIPVYKSHGNVLHEEAAVLASLQHRNIVRYYDAWIEEPYDDLMTRQFVVSPRQPGGSIHLSFSGPNMQTSEKETSTGVKPLPDGFRVSASPHRMVKFPNQLNCSKDIRPSARNRKERPIKYLFILMEYCAEDNLANAITDRRLLDKPQLAIELFRQILEALSYIHEKGIIHRDIKPSNIFLKSENGVLSIKLGDFGLTAKLQTGPSSTNICNATGMVGTLHYMSPEQERGDSYDEKVDIYAAGVVLFEMLYPPFDTTMERAAVLSSFSSAEKKWPSEFQSRVDNRILKILDSMLCIDPAKRPSASYLLQSEIFAATNLDTDTLYQVVSQYPHSMESSQLLKSLFTRRIPDDTEPTYNEQTEASSSKTSYINIELCSRYSHEFTSKGAIRYEAPLFVESLEDNTRDTRDGTRYRLLLDDGRTCQMRTSVLRAFAESIPPIFCVVIRRWYWGKAYSKETTSGRHPSESWRCAYNIVADYSIMMQEVGSNANALDAFFCAELVSVAVRPLLKFSNCSVTVEWTHVHFIRCVLEDCIGVHESQSEGLELLIIDNIKRVNVLKQTVSEYLKSVTVAGFTYESLVNCILQFAAALPISGVSSLVEFLASIARILRSYGRPLDRFNSHAANLYYMECFLSIKDCTFQFMPLGFPAWHRQKYSKFSFSVNYIIDKKEFLSVVHGGCINSIMPQRKGIIFGPPQRNVFGFEVYLDPLVSFFQKREASLLGRTGINTLQLGYHLFPQVLICVHDDSLMNRAIVLEGKLQKVGIIVEKQLGIPSSMRKLRKHMMAGLLQLSRLEVIIIIKYSSTTPSSTSTAQGTNAPADVQYKVFYTHMDAETVKFA